MANIVNHEIERKKDVEKIIKSKNSKRVVVAGPGTGKSYLFQEIIKEKIKESKSDFVAITFVGKLGDALADDLCGLAQTFTMHGFARQVFLKGSTKDWVYYPRIYEIIKEDLKLEGIKSFEIGDQNYLRKTNYYKAVGDEDVIFYATKICEKDDNKIPMHDLILIDEFQDFTETESKFIDLLTAKNEVVIVGDDDQALYIFRGSSPKYIRERYSNDNKDFESHTLRFCSRCPRIIIKTFHEIIKYFKLDTADRKRIVKEYNYFSGKDDDSNKNQKINLIKNCPPGMIAFKIKEKLEKITKDQKIKHVLIIGDGQTYSLVLSQIATQLINYGFKNVCSKNSSEFLFYNQDVIDAYRFIAKNDGSILGWRILGSPSEIKKKKHLKNAKTLNAIVNGTPAVLKNISQVKIDELRKEINKDFMIGDDDVINKFLFKELKDKLIRLKRPLANLNITVCSILGSKGLGADVVFVVGFDQGRLPKKDKIEEDEIYKMLVALTRVKKRIYFINSINSKVSSFINSINKTDLEVEEISLKK